MKKIKLLLVIISLFVITGCTTGNITQNNKEYNITYFVNGEEVILQPQKYTEGKGCNLPTPEVEDGYIFFGWYNNYNYQGNEITSISATDTGHKTLFGKIESLNENPVVDNKKLEEALQVTNYSFTYNETEIDYEYSETYKVTADAIQIKYEYDGYYYIEYLDMSKDEYRIVYEGENDWYYTLEGDEYYDILFQFYIILNLDEINVDNFVYNVNKNCYSVKNEYINNEIENILAGYEEDFKSLDIYLENDKLSKIEIDSSYEYEGVIYDITYELAFTNINTTVINIPDAIYDDNFSYEITSINDVYSKSINDEVTIEGYVTGIYGNNFYLTDDTGSILIYMGSSTEFNDIVEDNEYIVVTGTISSYKDVYQIIDVTALSYGYSMIEIYAETLTDLSQNNLESATLTKLPTTQSLSSDISFKISLNNEEVDVFISKHLDDTITQELLSYINGLELGDKFNLNNLHVGKYTKYQLIVTSITTFEYFEDIPSYQTGIITYPTNLTVEQGITIDEIYGMISVYAKYSNNKEILLTTSDYIKETNFKDEIGTYEITYTQDEFSVTVEIIVIEKGSGYIKPKLSEQPLRDEAVANGLTRGLPSVGEPKVLVIPVEFTDYPAPTGMVESLNKAFFGRSEDTGWESLQSYYYKSSYGKLKITGTVLQPYNTGKKSTKYTYNNNGDYEIIKAALEYYDDVIDY